MNDPLTPLKLQALQIAVCRAQKALAWWKKFLATVEKIRFERDAEAWPLQEELESQRASDPNGATVPVKRVRESLEGVARVLAELNQNPQRQQIMDFYMNPHRHTEEEGWIAEVEGFLGELTARAKGAPAPVGDQDGKPKTQPTPGAANPPPLVNIHVHTGPVTGPAVQVNKTVNNPPTPEGQARLAAATPVEDKKPAEAGVQERTLDLPLGKVTETGQGPIGERP